MGVLLSRNSKKGRTHLHSHPSVIHRALGLADLAKVTVTGLTDITAKLKDPNAERSKVRVAIELSESGILSVTEATATVEAKEPEDKPTLAGMSGHFIVLGTCIFLWELAINVRFDANILI